MFKKISQTLGIQRWIKYHFGLHFPLSNEEQRYIKRSFWKGMSVRVFTWSVRPRGGTRVLVTRLPQQHCRISLKKQGMALSSSQSFDKCYGKWPSHSLVPLLQHAKHAPASGPLHRRFPQSGMPFPQMRGLATSFPSGLCSHVTLAVRPYLTTVLKNCNFTPAPPTHTLPFPFLCIIFSLEFTIIWQTLYFLYVPYPTPSSQIWWQKPSIFCSLLYS